jgi:hypothetical protein
MLNYGHSRMLVVTTHRTPQSGNLEVNRSIQVQTGNGTVAEYQLMAVVNYFPLERNHFVHLLHPSSTIVLCSLNKL